MKKQYKQPEMICELLEAVDLLCFSQENEGAGDEIEF